MGGLAAVEPAADVVLSEGGIVLGFGGVQVRRGSRERHWGRLRTGWTFCAHDLDAVAVSDSLSRESRQAHGLGEE